MLRSRNLRPIDDSKHAPAHPPKLLEDRLELEELDDLDELEEPDELNPLDLPPIDPLLLDVERVVVLDLLDEPVDRTTEPATGLLVNNLFE